MSAVIEVNQQQLDACLGWFEKLKTNMNTNIRPQLVEFMNFLMSVAQEETHMIKGTLKAGWYVTDSQSAGVINALLDNQVAYAQEEFDRPGVKPSTGTVHDVRPELADLANSQIETVIFGALIEGLE